MLIYLSYFTPHLPFGIPISDQHHCWFSGIIRVIDLILFTHEFTLRNLFNMDIINSLTKTCIYYIYIEKKALISFLVLSGRQRPR